MGASSNNRDKAFAAQKKYAQNIIDEYKSPSGTRVGILTYGNTVRTSTELSEMLDAKGLKIKVNNLKNPGDGAKFDLALKAALDMLRSKKARISAKKSIILFTDSKNSGDVSDLYKYSNDLKSSNIKLVVVGFGKDVDESELKGIVGNPGDVIVVEDYEKLPKGKEVVDKTVTGM